MTDDISALTVQLAQDPSSLVFLPLAEALRKRGQLDAALVVAVRGVGRYPNVADGYDLLARIHSDKGDGDAAFDAWTNVLKLTPDHLGAHKGLAFLAYRSGDLRRSLKHLSRALELAPGDQSLSAVLERVRTAVSANQANAPVAAQVHAPDAGGAGVGPSGPDQVEAALLFDVQGRVLRGRMEAADGSDASDAVAAALAGVSREAERTARLLELGEWQGIAIEGGPANFELRSPTAETLLVVARGREVPAGRLARIADRAAADARAWLEEVG